MMIFLLIAYSSIKLSGCGIWILLFHQIAHLSAHSISLLITSSLNFKTHEDVRYVKGGLLKVFELIS